MIKTRFAPSPTGYIHLGNVRTAIHSALASKAYQKPAAGIFQLRIEDTDLERSKAIYIKAIQEDLQALGWHWQEGITTGGEHAPYQQSLRNDIYQQRFDQLLDSGHAYPCFCSQDRLQKMRFEQQLAGHPPRYDGLCRNLEAAIVQQKIAEGIPYVLRFNSSLDGNPEVCFSDLVKGQQRFLRHQIGDFIIRKSNGSPTFFFCNAIDDSLMGISQVLRGDDHLSNTPRQIMILQALDLPIPEYAHLSTILGEDGQPFSKRNGSRSIRELLQQGWLASAINNYLARLGHYYASDELLNNQQLSELFDIAHISKSAARFDWSLLRHWQRKALLTLTVEEQWQWLKPTLNQYFNDAQGKRFTQAICANILLPSEALDYYNIIYKQLPQLNQHHQQLMAKVPKEFFEFALSAYQRQPDFGFISQQLQQQTGRKGKQLFLPLRLALTGQSEGPEIQTLIALIPQQIVKKRLQYWI